MFIIASNSKLKRMQDKSDKKEFIIKKAFEVFLSKGYESASMTILHRELNISRGAMYRYFPSKDDLFIAVVDKYIFEMLDKFQPNEETEQLTVAKRIELSYSQIQKTAKLFNGIEDIEDRFLNYTALTIQAAKIYPDFIEKWRTYRGKSCESWGKTLLKAVNAGEIKPDVDIELLAKFFSKGNNFFEDSEDGSQFFIKGIKSGKKMINYIYSLIKV
jgi:AcrR family transcriptional regulator